MRRVGGFRACFTKRDDGGLRRRRARLLSTGGQAESVSAKMVTNYTRLWCRIEMRVRVRVDRRD